MLIFSSTIRRPSILEVGKWHDHFLTKYETKSLKDQINMNWKQRSNSINTRRRGSKVQIIENMTLKILHRLRYWIRNRDVHGNNVIQYFSTINFNSLNWVKMLQNSRGSAYYRLHMIFYCRAFGRKNDLKRSIYNENGNKNGRFKEKKEMELLGWRIE